MQQSLRNAESVMASGIASAIHRDDGVTFHDGAAIGMGEIPDHYEDAVVIISRGYPALWRRQVGEKSNVTPHAPIAP